MLAEQCKITDHMVQTIFQTKPVVRLLRSLFKINSLPLMIFRVVGVYNLSFLAAEERRSKFSGFEIRV